MGKDDWPEGTEAGALIDEAYRKGWLPRDATPRAEGGEQESGAEDRVEGAA